MKLKNSQSIYQELENKSSLKIVNGIVCLNKLRTEDSLSLISSSELSETQVINFLKTIENSDSTLEIQNIQSLVDKGLYFNPRPLFHFIKRTFDIVCSFLMIVFLSLPMLVIAILVKIDSKGPVLYKHKRYGKNKKIFNLLKFRSMRLDDRPLEEQLSPEQLKEFKKDFKLDNDPRITKLGKFLRKTSLDELPQLFNILAGQMSFVGPRPIIIDELSRYGNSVDVLLCIRPGLTSYWASNGRSNVNYDERINMELYYVKHRGCIFDIKILFKTFVSVIKKEGAK